MNRSTFTRDALVATALLFSSLCSAELRAQDPGAPDEIRLRGGDRLTGKVTAITADGVEIDAANFGADPVSITVATDRIESLQVGGEVDVQTAAGERLAIRIDGVDSGVVRTADGRELAVGDLVTPTPPVAWTGSVDAGGAYSTGNTERRSAAVSAEVIRQTDDNRLRVKGTYNYASERSTDPYDPPDTRDFRTTQRRMYGQAKYDHFVSDCAYALANLSGETDELANLDLRLIAGAGGGYQLFDADEFSLGLEAGLTWIEERRPDQADLGYVAARAAASMSWDVASDIRLLLDAEIYPSLEDANDVYGRFDTRLRTNLAEDLFAQIQWIFNYDNTPAKRQDGTSLDRQDHQLMFTVGYSF